MGIKKTLCGTADDFFKGMRLGFSYKPSDIKGGTKRVLRRKPKFGSFKNLGVK